MTMLSKREFLRHAATIGMGRASAHALAASDSPTAARDASESIFRTRGAVLVVKDMETTHDWPTLVNAAGLTTLTTGRAWMLKESFDHFWSYRSMTWAVTFLAFWCWCERALRSRLEPMRKVASMLRAHEALLLNWFRAKGGISNGPIEGLNNNIRVATTRSYGFRTYHAIETALYHNSGRLPEPLLTHTLCCASPSFHSSCRMAVKRNHTAPHRKTRESGLPVAATTDQLKMLYRPKRLTIAGSKK